MQPNMPNCIAHDFLGKPKVTSEVLYRRSGGAWHLHCSRAATREAGLWLACTCAIFAGQKSVIVTTCISSVQCQHQIITSLNSCCGCCDSLRSKLRHVKSSYALTVLKGKQRMWLWRHESSHAVPCKLARHGKEVSVKHLVQLL